MIRVFISGPYTADTKEGVNKNIEVARKAAVELCREGFAVFTPHLNTGHFEDYYDDYDFYLKMCREFIPCCDAVLMLPGWEDSKGATIEYHDANYHKRHIFKNIEVLKQFYKRGKNEIPKN